MVITPVAVNMLLQRTVVVQIDDMFYNKLVSGKPLYKLQIEGSISVSSRKFCRILGYSVSLCTMEGKGSPLLNNYGSAKRTLCCNENVTLERRRQNGF